MRKMEASAGEFRGFRYRILVGSTSTHIGPDIHFQHIQFIRGPAFQDPFRDGVGIVCHHVHALIILLEGIHILSTFVHPGEQVFGAFVQLGGLGIEPGLVLFHYQFIPVYAQRAEHIRQFLSTRLLQPERNHFRPLSDLQGVLRLEELVVLCIGILVPHIQQRSRIEHIRRTDVNRPGLGILVPARPQDGAVGQHIHDGAIVLDALPVAVVQDTLGEEVERDHPVQVQEAQRNLFQLILALFFTGFVHGLHVGTDNGKQFRADPQLAAVKVGRIALHQAQHLQHRRIVGIRNQDVLARRLRTQTLQLEDIPLQHPGKPFAGMAPDIGIQAIDQRLFQGNARNRGTEIIEDVHQVGFLEMAQGLMQAVCFHQGCKVTQKNVYLSNETQLFPEIFPGAGFCRYRLPAPRCPSSDQHRPAFPGPMRSSAKPTRRRI